MATAAEIAFQLYLEESGNGFVGQCPSCGYERAFSVSEQDGHLLVHCHAGCTQQELIKVLLEYELWPAPNPSDIFAEATGASPVRPRKSDSVEAALEIWDRSKPAEGTLVEAYLRARGYHGPIPASLRYVTGKHAADGQFHPVMVAAAVRIDKDPPIVGVHRTFLKENGSGKALLVPDKMTLGKIKGAGIPLAAPGPKLAVSEGIETGLSVQQATGIPTWAALSAGGLTTLVLPEVVKEVFIAADSDDVGQDRAQSAAWRWFREGRRVHLINPPKGMDFNDLARKAA
jgi:putative DNA primase/helicase